uniref:Suppressor of silencing P0 n=1 Tax=Cucurbit aphid-borne yellows virus TaxID=91753 RepID=A0A499UDH6_9VIRU|nr:suppressor of silencing P0 [Cucurbit aphid-borne yellows virus]
MQIESVKQQLIFRPTRHTSFHDRKLNIYYFLIKYTIFLASHGIKLLRLFLARLPLLISEQLSGDYVYTPGASKRIILARFHRHCGAPLPSSSAVDLRLPASKDVARFFLARHYSRIMGEGLQRHQTSLFRGYAEFAKFINVWCSSTTRRLRESTPRDFSSYHILVELSNLGHSLCDLVLNAGAYDRNALARLAVHVHRIYGEDGGLDFWRLANFPSKSWPFNGARYFEGSVVQKVLQC